jgi:hypothetical protein
MKRCIKHSELFKVYFVNEHLAVTKIGIYCPTSDLTVHSLLWLPIQLNK